MHRMFYLMYIFNVLFNVTGCFTAWIGLQSPTVELDNAIRFRLLSGSPQGMLETRGTAQNSPAISFIVSFKTCHGLEC